MATYSRHRRQRISAIAAPLRAGRPEFLSTLRNLRREERNFSSRRATAQPGVAPPQRCPKRLPGSDLQRKLRGGSQREKPGKLRASGWVSIAVPMARATHGDLATMN
jgi:hypothetical protein